LGLLLFSADFGGSVLDFVVDSTAFGTWRWFPSQGVQADTSTCENVTNLLRGSVKYPNDTFFYGLPGTSDPNSNTFARYLGDVTPRFVRLSIRAF
jgi:hypothetical protein